MQNNSCHRLNPLVSSPISTCLLMLQLLESSLGISRSSLHSPLSQWMVALWWRLFSASLFCSKMLTRCRKFVCCTKFESLWIYPLRRRYIAWSRKSQRNHGFSDSCQFDWPKIILGSGQPAGRIYPWQHLCNPAIIPPMMSLKRIFIGIAEHDASFQHLKIALQSTCSRILRPKPGHRPLSKCLRPLWYWICTPPGP